MTEALAQQPFGFRIPKANRKLLAKQLYSGAHSHSKQSLRAERVPWKYVKPMRYHVTAKAAGLNLSLRVDCGFLSVHFGSLHSKIRVGMIPSNEICEGQLHWRCKESNPSSDLNYKRVTRIHNCSFLRHCQPWVNSFWMKSSHHRLPYWIPSNPGQQWPLGGAF